MCFLVTPAIFLIQTSFSSVDNAEGCWLGRASWWEQGSQGEEMARGRTQIDMVRWNVVVMATEKS